jgi:peptidoglycan/xylan/chitin deacetylase (PgdA/CDA1 family)
MDGSIDFMMGGLWRVRTPVALILGLFAGIAAPGALASDCPGHPDALGTSRTLVVDPREHPRIGRMQYPETLPLADHEVVLTFDDGPLPHNSNQILDILAAQCVKATFFAIGRMAKESPEGIRKLRDAGHTIGTHTQNHPLSMNRMPIEQAKQEIDEGIASVKAALGDDTTLAPFFRIPGLLRADGVEEYLASQGIQIWSADFPADDWRHVPSSRVYDLAMSRLEAKGKGILLLHDIQARTVAALPKILHELKVRGYHIVHVVPATSERPATPTEPQQWQLHPLPENVVVSRWQDTPNVVASTASLSAPSLAEFNWLDGQSIALAKPFNGAPSDPAAGNATWPTLSELPPRNAPVTLPAPARSLFELQPGLHEIHPAPLSDRTARTVSNVRETTAKPPSANVGRSRYASRGRIYLARRLTHGRQRGMARSGHRATASAHKEPRRPLVQIKKRSA